MIKTGIICGCLPKQHNIKPKDLYHYLLKTKLRSEKGIEMEVCSEWYTRQCDKIQVTKNFVEINKPDILLYHVRPDPFLRMCRLLVRYKNNKQQLKVKINFNADDSMIMDKDIPPNLQQRKKPSFLKNIGRSANYLLGFCMGSYRAAAQNESDVLEELSEITGKSTLQLIIVGPASRPRSLIEDMLLGLLEKKLNARFNLKETYIKCHGKKDHLKNSFFSDDLVHLNELGHLHIAKLIYEKLQTILK